MRARSRTSALATATTAALLLLTPARAQNPCYAEFGNATFDLSDVAGQELILEDFRREGYESENLYQVAICGDVNPNNYPKCDPQLPAEPRTAIQYIEGNEQSCHVVAGNYDDPKTNPTWSLMNKDDPSLGVSLSYYNGEPCQIRLRNGQTVTRQRSIRLDFMCAEQLFVPSKAEVIEDSVCMYHAVLETAYGCPTECPVGKPEGVHAADKPCFGNGVCRFGEKEDKSRCFCNLGYEGSDCASQCDMNPAVVKRGSKGGAIAGGLFGGIALGALIGAAAYYYLYVYRPKQQHAARSSGAAAAQTSAWAGLSSGGYVPPEGEGVGEGVQSRDHPLL